jgi:Family of unknown function (DUF5995)
VSTGPIDALLARMESLLVPMRESDDQRQHFLAVYLRTTRAVKDDLAQGGFVDADWTERWDVVFADLYLDALEAWNASGDAPGPWAIAFGAANDTPRVPPLRHLLLGMNAHVNYDLPQALIAVISDDEFDDADLVARRSTDHAHIDEILASRVPAEDRLLKEVEQAGDRTLLDAMLTPFNRAGTRRFLKEARAKVWRNAKALSRARQRGPDELANSIEQLGRLAAARVADLRRPGQVILRLSRSGFGVLLPDA